MTTTLKQQQEAISKAMAIQSLLVWRTKAVLSPMPTNEELMNDKQYVALNDAANTIAAVIINPIGDEAQSFKNGYLKGSEKYEELRTRHQTVRDLFRAQGNAKNILKDALLAAKEYILTMNGYNEFDEKILSQIGEAIKKSEGKQ